MAMSISGDIGENPLPCLFQHVQASAALGVWPFLVFKASNGPSGPS